MSTTPNLALPELIASQAQKHVTINETLRVLACDTPSVLYATADEIADFGAPQASLSVAVYQLSATVGRGVATTAQLAL